MAPRGYLIQGDSCCYAPLVQDCPYQPSSGIMPSASTMMAPVMPKKIVYGGVVSGEGVVPSDKTEADEWISDIFLGQEVPILHTEFYFDSSDHTTQLGTFMNVNAGPQFINATTTFNGKWTNGPVDASFFDLSEYDCSSPCNNEVTTILKHTAKTHQKQKQN